MPQRGARTPDVSVAIATIDRPEGLARCVAGVLAGTRLPRELVIVDQSRDDRTAAVVADAGWDRVVPVRYIRSSRRGLAASRNTAVAHASSSIVAFTDDDCVPHAEWLAAVMGAFASADEPDVVTGRVLALGGEGDRRHSVATRKTCVAAQFRGAALPWAVGTGGNAAVRQEWLARIGGFDEQLGAGSPGQSAEDMDLFRRLLRAGALARYEPAAVVFHERADRRGMTRRAWSYGYGMGAFCALRARQGDAYAWWIGARWCADRVRMFAGNCVLRRWHQAVDEVRMVWSAGRGIAYGLACAGVDGTRLAPEVGTAPRDWCPSPEGD